MARLELLDASNAPLSVQHYFAGGDPGPIVAALATVPEMVGPALGFIGPALSAAAVGVRAKEFAILRTSALQGCTYCIHAHSAVARDVGLSVDEVKALRGEASVHDTFTDDKERALIGWIDALAGATGPVHDDAWATARSHWSEAELVEISVTVGATMFLNRFATAFQLPSADHVVSRLNEEGLA
jgi:AhpD family alkylhydroperoxidase